MLEFDGGIAYARAMARVRAYEAAVARLHVGIHEDAVPMLLLHDGVPEEQPDAVFRGHAALLPNRADLARLPEHTLLLADSEGFQLVAKRKDNAFLCPHCADHAAQVPDFSHAHGSPFRCA